MKKIILPLAMAALPLFCLGQEIEARLLSIRYYSGCGCGNGSPVRVRVSFAADYPSPGSLSVVIKHGSNVTYNARVKEYGPGGRICYSFCSRPGEASSFDIYFRGPNGERSNVFSITAIPEAGGNGDEPESERKKTVKNDNS